MFRARRVVLLLLTVAWAACDKKSAAPTSSAPPPGMPPLSGETAAPGDKPVHPPMGQVGGQAPGMPPDHPALPAGHPPMGEIDPGATTPGEVELDPKGVISGVLRLDDKVKSKVANGDTIFLVARQAEASGAPGPILAVKKLSAAQFPMAFQLDGRDAMMAGTKMSGKVVLTVRVDKDGDAMTKNPGDVTGVSKALPLPSEKVVVTLDTVL